MHAEDSNHQLASVFYQILQTDRTQDREAYFFMSFERTGRRTHATGATATEAHA